MPVTELVISLIAGRDNRSKASLREEKGLYFGKRRRPLRRANIRHRISAAGAERAANIDCERLEFAFRDERTGEK
jgi:hypothetical protein